jgi:hypothetical protein
MQVLHAIRIISQSLAQPSRCGRAAAARPGLAGLAVGLAFLLSAGPAGAQDRLPARARVVTRGPYFVAQEVMLEVTTVAGGTRPTLRLPGLSGGATLAVAGQAMRPISTSAIGDVVNESIQYGWQLRLVPARAGPVAVPPIALQAGGRAGATAPLRLEVRTPPATGRPSGFLGGVGAIRARLEVRPGAVRVDEPAEVRLVLDGPGSRGSTRPLSDLIDRLGRLPVAPEVRALPDEAVDDPPRRVRRLRLRPTRAGEVTLPPVIVSWFDPDGSLYQGTLASAVTLRVVDVPRLDPAALVLPEASARSGRGDSFRDLARGLALGVLILAAATLGAFRYRRWSAGPRREAIRLARRLCALDRDADPAEAAEVITGALGDYLRLAVGRAPGVLTPPEAAEGVRGATGRDDLARAALALVERCDAARYAGRDAAEGRTTAAGLIEDGARLLESLAAVRRRRDRGAG